MKKYIQTFILLTFITFVSCKENKQEELQVKTQNNITKTIDEANEYAKKLYGDNAVLLLKGDLNANGYSDAFAIILIAEKAEMKFWIKQGGVIEKDNDGWKVLLNFKEKVYNTSGLIIDQIEALNGYIISFDMKSNPVNFSVTIADKQGNPSSDELNIGWNKDKNIYELIKPESIKIP